MANIRKWIAQARRLEGQGDLDGALATFRKALVLQEETSGFADLSLYNGLGDLYLRSDRADDAVDAFERAAAQCEEQQLYANGIALCKKILRNAPGHRETYRRAARLYALSGLEAEARQHFEEYADRAGDDLDERELLEIRREMVELIADEEAAVELADALAAWDRKDEAAEMLRAAKERRERDGRSVVHLVRKLQEIQPRVTVAPPLESERIQRRPSPAGSASTAETPRAGSDARGSSAVNDPAGSDGSVASLARELERALSGGDGDEAYRRALPILDRLLERQPKRFDLLHRKLAYAYQLGEAELAVEAYLALGESLDRHFDAFSLRTLSTSTPQGAVTAAVKVESAAEAAPGS